MAFTLGFEPGPHWWEASALTTAPPLLPFVVVCLVFMGLKLALPPMAFTVPYLYLFFELVFHLFFDGTVCSFFFIFFFIMKNVI